MGFSIGIHIGGNRGGRKKAQRFRLSSHKCLEGLEKGPDSDLLGNLEIGATTGHMSDLRISPEGIHRRTKRRVYDEQRRFVGNYKTVVGKEEALRKLLVDIWKRV